MTPTTRDLILGEHGLASLVCLCGDPKNKHTSFCSNCYRTLPDDLQEGLYRRIGDGYPEAHAAAVRHLRAVGRAQR